MKSIQSTGCPVPCHLLLLSMTLAVFMGNVPSEAADPEARPNILLLVGDNWAWPHAGACGDRSVKTPTFDRIAKRGVLFTHTFCQVPSCSAARAVGARSVVAWI